MVIGRLARKPARSRQRTRAFVLLAVTSLWSVAVLARLTQLQVVDHESLVARADDQHTAEIRLAGRRGDVFARNGELLATSVQLQSVYAHPALIDDPKRVAALLTDVVGVSEAGLLDRLRRDSRFVYLRRKVAPDVATRVRELIEEFDIEGVALLPESKRYYPQRGLAAQVVGAVDIDNEGRFGVERQYDHLIAGAEGRFNAMRDGWSNRLGSRGTSLLEPTRGHDIRLTIDWGIQYAAEEALARAVVEKEAKGGTVIALDARSGAVLAMANYPELNLNANNDPSFVKNQENSAVSFLFEPGSVFKVITAAAALQEGVVTEDETIDCEGGFYRVANWTYRDWKAGFGLLSFREVLMQSSNVGTIKVAQRLAPETFHAWIQEFGFGTRTGIDLPNEIDGRLQSPDRWSRLSQSSMAFGQEIGASPIQMANALATIANGGMLMQPYVLAGVRDPQGRELQHINLRDGGARPVGVPVAPRRVIDAAVAGRVASIMEHVVATGTGMPAGIPGYRISGKTSTAQKYNAEAGRYTGYVAGFGGFLPTSDPRVVIFVAIDEPRRGTGHGGSAAAAPVFREVAEAAIRILRLAPDATLHGGVGGSVPGAVTAAQPVTPLP